MKIVMRLISSILAGIVLSLLAAAIIYAFIFVQYFIGDAEFHYKYFVYYSLKKSLFVGVISAILFFLGGPRKRIQ